ncbi:MAG TPA: fibronectin type III domain-containing protein [Longimicrobiaceae bacterium]|nr:fibronectin type III domain-containing protein [Longimicrobiaceae bacterium]
MSSTPPSLTVQVVNDSGNADSAVFLLLTGASVAVSGNVQWLQLPQATKGTATAGALNLLAQQGTMVSPYTGETLPVYEFTVDTLTSGRLMVSLGTAIEYDDNAAPTATSQAMRWDKIEFGYPASGADLTSIDFFGIPLQFDYLDADGNVLASMSYYTSTHTLLSSLYALSPSTMANAFQQVSGNAPSFGWNPTTGSLADFLRVIGPQTFTGDGGSPAPYPSFAGYLAALETAGTTFTISGVGGVGSPAPANNSVTYDYTGTVASDGSGGYLVAFTGTTTAVSPNTDDGPFGLYTDSTGTTTAAQLPANLPVTLALTAATLDNDIYGAVATAFTVGQSTDPKGSGYIDPTLVEYTANSAYANLAGDFIAGLNFGYPGGTDGANSAVWYGNPPTPYPFAGARATNDGFYNPFAAVLYNQSDAYGFPFSDRNGRPSPFVWQPANATTLRITILNDQRLDAPQVAVTQPADSLVTLTWPAVNVPPGATLTGYALDISPPLSGWDTTVPADTLTVTAGGLAAGTTYTFTLTAQGTAANGQTITSRSTVVTATTGGTASSPSGDYSFDVALTWTSAAPPPTGATFTVGGVAFQPTVGTTPGTNAIVSGTAGANVIPLLIENGSETIYAGNYYISLVADGGGYNVDSSGSFMLDGNSQPLIIQGTPPFTNGAPLVIGTPFAPFPGKQVNPVVFPSASSST